MRQERFWNIYLFVFILLGLISIPVLIKLRLPLQILRASLFWLPAPLGIYLFIKKKKQKFTLFWKIYFVYYIIDIIYEWFWLKHFFAQRLGLAINFTFLIYLAEIFFLLPSIFALGNYAYYKH